MDDGVRVKLFTHILALHPLNGEREKTQKVFITDAADDPISLWLPKTKFPLLEQLQKDEYFLLKATVRSVPQNKEARFLLLQAIARGKDAFRDPAVRTFCETRLRLHADAFLADLALGKKYELGGNEDLYVLNLALSGLLKDTSAPDPAPKEEDPPMKVNKPVVSKKGSLEVIKMACYECNK